ncbi:hypothetical protein [Couchioplanes caeruleus]|uniref:MFS transporter n=1 Tax=Couchioplanes caeruleus subsp. caeruleus TaxID=56427 RepID=A0A1K0FDZ0_9ACTN|nr:hypothetical protein [Couchioplanes caeruleus]OJF11061.1 hypothetical protein BG844_28335 [Couchioplanes caeruleus subsp. caeruleus]
MRSLPIRMLAFDRFLQVRKAAEAEAGFGVRLLMSFGLGCVTGLAMGTATAGVEPADAGAAGAAVNAMQQVGGSLGTALL